MGEPFKDQIGPAAVARLAARLGAARSTFDAEAFAAAAEAGLDALELKGRVRHVATVLRPFLAEDWAEAVAHMLDALPPPLEGTEGVSEGFELWPLLQLVEDHGRAHFDVSVPALRSLTRRFSAEFAIRPYLDAEPERTLAVLAEWASDPDPHVRRLVSEGSRPRLPWGMRLRVFQDDPTPVLELLEQLKDDPERYVQRSVANNLNDIAKDHPDVVIEVARRWARNPTPGRTWIVRHALRTLVKRGNTQALVLLGYEPPEVELVSFALGASEARVGDRLPMVLRLRSTGHRTQRLLVDYKVWYRSARGTLRPKVFKWAVRTLEPGDSVDARKEHSLVPVTTRRHYPGPHRIEVQVNGVVLGGQDFELLGSR